MSEAPTAESSPFRYRMPVRFDDVDHAGIVYYPRFFHFFHVCFEEFFRDRLGPESYVQLIDVERIGFPAVRAECDYRAPLRFSDTAEVELTLAHMGARSVAFRYRVRRVSPGEPVLCADGRVTCAVTDLQSFRAVPVPEALRALFLELGGVEG